MSDGTNTVDPLGARAQLTTSQGTDVTYYRLEKLVEDGLLDSIDRLPYTVRILLENVLRNYGGEFAEEQHLKALAGWKPYTDANPQTALLDVPAALVQRRLAGERQLWEGHADGDAVGRL